MSAQSSRPVALVTGAARRIGRAIALDLADAGHDVAVHFHRSDAAAEALCAELVGRGVRAAAFRADLTRAAEVTGLAGSVVDAFGGVDVLVNNASAFHATPLEATGGEALAADLRLFLAVHVEAPLWLTHALLPGLRERRGAVVNVGDAAALRPGYIPYTVSKAALRHLTRALARELAPDVRVNGVAPGAILPPAGAPEGTAERLAERIPSGRLGTPEEVAAAVRFLATGPAFVSGQVLAVDGAEHV